jgi:trypsin
MLLIVAAALFAAPGAGAAAADGPTPRIIGGEKPAAPVYDAKLSSTVALVSMNAPSQYDGQFCGGALIDELHVLTAAHCIVENDPYTYRSAPGSIGVLAGAQALNERSLVRSQLVPVSTIFVSPFFNLNTFRYDAAILRLSRPITGIPLLPVLSEAESAALGIDTTEVGAIAAGWGDTDTSTDDCCFPSSIQSITMSIHTAETCSDNLDDGPGGTFDAPLQLCSGAIGRDTCQGDSGGPLIVDVEETPRLAGIVSNGVGCGDGYYGVYTKASMLRGWIESIPGIVDGDVRDPSHGPDDTSAPTITKATPVDYSRVRLDVTPGAGPAPSKYTVWLRAGRADAAQDTFIGTRSGSSFTIDLQPRRTGAKSQVLVRGVTANGESPAAARRVGPKIDRIKPGAPRSVRASRRGGTLTVTWRSGIDRQGGVAGHDVQRHVGGRWTRPVYIDGPKTRLTTRAGSSGMVRIRTRDWAGNVSAWTRSLKY